MKKKTLIIELEPRIMFDAVGAAVIENQVETASTDKSNTKDTSTQNVVETIDANSSLAKSSDKRNELVVIDGGLKDVSSLVDEIRAIDSNRTIMVLDSTSDEVSQLTSYLAEHTGEFDTIHVISHGTTDTIELGNIEIDLASPDNNTALWQSVKTSLTQDGDLLLYGCNVASDETSQNAIVQLAQITGADIAASTDVTGISGDWDLEYQSGLIESKTLKLSNYQNDLWVNGTSAVYGAAYTSNGIFEAAWWGDPVSNMTAATFYTDNTTQSPRDLTFGTQTAGAGVEFSMVSTGDASIQAVSGVNSTTYAQAVTNNDYFYVTMIDDNSNGNTNGVTLNSLRYNQISSSKRIQGSLTPISGLPSIGSNLNNTGSYIALALYDVDTGTLTKLSNDLSVNGTSGGIYAPLTKVPITPDKNYELRFYTWRTDTSASTVYFDNPVVFSYFNEAPTATADSFTVNRNGLISGNCQTNC